MTRSPDELLVILHDDHVDELELDNDMVATRRAPKAAVSGEEDDAPVVTRKPSLKKLRKTTAASPSSASRTLTATPVKIEFADDGDDNEVTATRAKDVSASEEAAQSNKAARVRRRTTAGASTKSTTRPDESREEEDDEENRRSTATARPKSKARASQPVVQSRPSTSSLNIAEIRQMMRDAAGPNTPPVKVGPPSPTSPKPTKAAAEAPSAVKKTRATASVKRSTSSRKVTSSRTSTKQGSVTSASDLVPLLQRIVAVGLLLAWLFHNQQTHVIGYCDSSAQSVMDTSAVADSTVFDGGHSNELLRALELQDAHITSNDSAASMLEHHDTSLPWQVAFVPPYLRPSCSPCPAHAVCKRGVLVGCASGEYAATRPALLARVPILRNLLPHDGTVPTWLGGTSSSPSASDSASVKRLPNLLPVRWLNKPVRWVFALARGPRCVPDTHKLFLALQVGDEIRRVTRERRGQMECGRAPSPVDAALLDVRAWEARVKTVRAAKAGGSTGVGGGSGSASASRKWGRSAKTETPLPLRNVPHWPEPFILDPSVEGDSGASETAITNLFTTDPRVYDSDDFVRFNATAGAGGYIRWDLLQQHYADIRYAEPESAIKADLLRRIDVGELHCSTTGAETRRDSVNAGEDGEDGVEERDPLEDERARACFDELWELAVADLQRSSGVLRFPVTGIPPSTRASRQADAKGDAVDPYTAPLLLSTTSTRSLACSVRLAAIGIILDTLPWFILSSVLVGLLGWGRRRSRERREEAEVAAVVREEVLVALRERARGSEAIRRSGSGRSGDGQGEEEGDTTGIDVDASALLGDLSLGGADEDGQAYLPIAHLRDVLLPTAGSDRRRASPSRLTAMTPTGVAREQLSSKRAKRVWASVRRQVGANSNVRTASRFWKGESMLVWEWVGV